ncbi:MAG: hypothetical protein R2773_01500 [Flavobacteriaceae bacterium]
MQAIEVSKVVNIKQLLIEGTKIHSTNSLLKMTYLNAPVIIVRQLISLFIRRIIAQYFGESGIFLQGQLRDLLQLLTSFTSTGIFQRGGQVHSEHRKEEEKLAMLFSTTFVFTCIGSGVSAIILCFGAIN